MKAKAAAGEAHADLVIARSVRWPMGRLHSIAHYNVGAGLLGHGLLLALELLRATRASGPLDVAQGVLGTHRARTLEEGVRNMELAFEVHTLTHGNFARRASRSPLVDVMGALSPVRKMFCCMPLAV